MPKSDFFPQLFYHFVPVNMYSFLAKDPGFMAIDLIYCINIFCNQELVSHFNFHNYDNLRHFVKKQDPRRQSGDERVRQHIKALLVSKILPV